MKVLFAVSNESIFETVVKKYEQQYKEKILGKNVYYFNAILQELQKDKTYDKVIISEDLEMYANNNYDVIDKFIFEKLNSISNEAYNNFGKEIPIILICADRRQKGDKSMVKIFEMGIYNALIGNDRSMDKLCKVLNQPQNKVQAKEYYQIQVEGSDSLTDDVENVSETEIQNILTHYKRLGKNEAKYVESFNSIVVQYNDTQLRLIAKFLPNNVRKVLAEKSNKYQQLMNTGTGIAEREKYVYNPKQDEKKQSIKNYDNQNKKIDFIEEQIEKKKVTGSVIIPNAERTVRKMYGEQNETIKNHTEDRIQNEEMYTEQRENSFQNNTENTIDGDLVHDMENNYREDNSMNNMENNDINKQKRGRGRPPKNQVQSQNDIFEFDLEDLDNKSNNNIEESKKRGRGRPPKKTNISQNNQNNKETSYSEKEDEDNDFIMPGTPKEYEKNDDELILPGMTDKFQDEEDDELILPGMEEEEEEIELVPNKSYNRMEENQNYNTKSNDYRENNKQYNVNNNQYNVNNNKYNGNINKYNENDEQYNGNINKYNENDEQYNGNINKYNENDNQYKENHITQYNNTNMLENVQNFITKDKKVISFVGTSKNGTSFIVNALAEMFSKQGIKTAILDLTKNKNAYYIYTKNDEGLRKIAFECIGNLKRGIDKGIEVNKNLTVFTSLPERENYSENCENILTTLIKNYAVVLLDCDFATDLQYIKASQELYVVQSMDVLTIQPITEYLRELKTKNILDQNKLRIILNKFTKIRGISENVIIGGIANYNEPAMSFMTELFNKDTVKYAVISFDMLVYVKYLEALIDCEISLGKISKNFNLELSKLGGMVYPLINTRKGQTFSSNIDNTLEKMKNNY